jgi:hypothetical protein
MIDPRSAGCVGVGLQLKALGISLCSVSVAGIRSQFSRLRIGDCFIWKGWCGDDFIPNHIRAPCSNLNVDVALLPVC